MANRKRLLTQAQAEALVRYQPQLDQLKALLGQAQDTYHGEVSAANTGRDVVQSAVSRVAPALHSLTQGLGLGAAQRGVTLTDELAKLGPVADSIKAAALAEGTGAANRLAASDLFNMADLSQRYVSAAQGAEYAKQHARGQLHSDAAKIADQINSVLGQQGAFTASTLESLTNAQLQRELQNRISIRQSRTTRRGQTLSHNDRVASRRETARHHRAQEQAAGRNGDGTGSALGPRAPKFTPKFHVKVRTADAHAAVRDGIDSAAAFARDYKQQGVARSTVAKWLTEGRAAQTVEVDGKKVKVPGIPRASSTLAAGIALDLAYDGHISRAHAEELWRRGILLRGVGLRLPRQGRGAQGAAPVAPGGSLGGSRPT